MTLRSMYTVLQEGEEEGRRKKVEVYEAAMEWISVENDTADGTTEY